MKTLALKSLIILGSVAAGVAAIALLALPVVYLLSEGFTRWLRPRRARGATPRSTNRAASTARSLDVTSRFQRGGGGFHGTIGVGAAGACARA